MLEVHQKFWPEIEALPEIKNLLQTIERPLISVLSRIERKGVLIDSEKLKSQSQRLAGRISELCQQVYDLAGREFNLGSPKQLQEVLYQELNLPVLEKNSYRPAFNR